MNFKQLKYTSALTLFLSVLLSCGGEDTSEIDFESGLDSPVAGGVDDEVLIDGQPGQLPNSDTNLPKINLGPRQFADSNVLLTIDAQVDAAAGANIASTLWTQVSGPGVILPSVKSDTLNIVTPFVAVTRILEFRYTAMDDQGRINSSTLPVVVRPLDSPVNVIGGVFNEFDAVAEFEIRLSEISANDISISYVTRDGSAVAGEDFDFISDTVVIPAGELTTNVQVALIDDDVEENDEAFSLQAVATDGTLSYANTGPAIIRNGIEPTIEQNIAFIDETLALNVGENATNPFAEGGEPLGNGDLMYLSADPAIATVDATGLVDALSPGTTTITATKTSDALYRSGEASFTVNVVSVNEAPVITYVNGEGAAIVSASIPGNSNPDLQVAITDAEEGDLPTAAQLADFESTGVPIAAYRWESDIDGSLDDGHLFPSVELSTGHHVIRFSAEDSEGLISTETIDLLVANIAQLESVTLSASSQLCEDPQNPVVCGFPEAATDGQLDTGSELGDGWVADVSQAPQTLSINWSGSARISEIELHMPEGQALSAFELSAFFNEGEGNIVNIATVDDNTDSVVRFTPVNLDANSLTLTAIRGPENDAGVAQINEFVVFGNALIGQNMMFDNPGPVELTVGDTFTNSFATDGAPLGTGALSYTSTNDTAASVDQNGIVTALAAGTTVIIADKEGDADHLSGQAGYRVNVIAENTPPIITFVDADGGTIAAVSISGLSGPDINTIITDAEEASLPTAAELSEFENTGIPLSNYRWRSDIDGDLGDGHLFPSSELSPGHHVITFEAEDSEGLQAAEIMDLLVANIAELGQVVAETELCTNPDDLDTCYLADNAIDARLDIDAGAGSAWAAELGGGPAELTLSWPAPGIHATDIEVYTTDGSPLSEFTLEGIDEQGTRFLITTITDNTDTVVSINDIDENVESIVLTAIHGADAEPDIGRVNELAVIGALLNAQTIAFADTGPVNLLVGERFTNTFATGSEPLGTGALNYASSDDTIATVDQTTGQVLAIAQGRATITLIKDADNEYGLGMASYDVSVSALNTPPTISFVNSADLLIDTVSITGKRAPDINVEIIDTEDGSLPTAAELAEFENTGVPLSNYAWVSDIDGELGDGHLFPGVDLSPGHHVISFSAEDSEGLETTETMELIVQNIAELGNINAKTELCSDATDPEECYEAENAIDVQFETGPGIDSSWATDLSGGPVELTLAWAAPGVYVEQIEVYTTEGLPLRDFDVEGVDGEGNRFSIASITDNDATVVRIDNINTAARIIVLTAIEGPEAEPDIGRVNELVVIGNTLATQTMMFANAGPVSLIENDTFTNTFAAAAQPQGTGALVYSSSDANIATVDQTGEVTAIEQGTATITATKAADDTFGRGVATFGVVVTPQNTAPTISFTNDNGAPINSTSITNNRAPGILTVINDAEDGSLPTSDQLAEFQATGVPITAYSWFSSNPQQMAINGTNKLGDGHLFPSTVLATGHHVIRFEATDSQGLTGTAEIDLLAGNQASLAFASATSEVCLNDSECFSPFGTVDGTTNPGQAVGQSWIGDMSNGPQTLTLSWSFAAVTAQSIKIFMPEGRALQDFTILAQSPAGGDIVLATVTDNSDTELELTVPFVQTTNIRIVVSRASEAEPNNAEIYEIAIFGTTGSIIGPS